MVGRAVSPPPAVALRRRDRVAAADGRARRHRATSTRPRASRREKMSEALARIAREHGMPIDTSLRDADVGDRAGVPRRRRRAPARARGRGRAAAGAARAQLRRRATRGRATREGAARDAGLDRQRSRAGCATPRSSARSTRIAPPRASPTPAALRAGPRLALGEAGAATRARPTRSSASPTALQIDVPGFQPYAPTRSRSRTSCPARERREPPESVLELLEWAGEPLATREVAVVCEHRARRGAPAARPRRDRAPPRLRRAVVAAGRCRATGCGSRYGSTTSSAICTPAPSSSIS